MSPSQSRADPNPGETAPPSRRSVLRGAAGVGAVGFAAAVGIGAAVAGLAIAAAFQRRVQQMDVPPTELARQHWTAVRHATATGVGVWRNEAPGLQNQPA